MGGTNMAVLVSRFRLLLVFGNRVRLVFSDALVLRTSGPSARLHREFDPGQVFL
jgi:hypothetical protein